MPFSTGVHCASVRQGRQIPKVGEAVVVSQSGDAKPVQAPPLAQLVTHFPEPELTRSQIWLAPIEAQSALTLQPQNPASVLQMGASPPQPALLAHWQPAPETPPAPLAQVSFIGHSALVEHDPQVPERQPGDEYGQSLGIRHWAQVSVEVSHTGRPGAQSALVMQSTHVMVIVLQTWPEQSCAPHITGLPASGTPASGSLPQKPLRQKSPTLQSPLVVHSAQFAIGVLCRQISVQVPMDPQPSPAGQSALVVQAPQMPAPQPSPARQSAELRHWTQLDAQ